MDELMEENYTFAGDDIPPWLRELCGDNFSEVLRYTVAVMVDVRPYTQPPNAKERRRISRAINRHRYLCSTNWLAHELASGCSFCPALFGANRKPENWIQQQVFVVTFNISGYTMEDFKAECDYIRVQPAIIVPTWSHTDERPHFHGVFVNSTVITSLTERDICQRNLLNLFPGADKQNMKLNRIYLGAQAECYLSDPEARLNLLKI